MVSSKNIRANGLAKSPSRLWYIRPTRRSSTAGGRFCPHSINKRWGGTETQSFNRIRVGFAKSNKRFSLQIASTADLDRIYGVPHQGLQGGVFAILKPRSRRCRSTISARRSDISSSRCRSRTRPRCWQQYMSPVHRQHPSCLYTPRTRAFRNRDKGKTTSDTDFPR